MCRRSEVSFQCALYHNLHLALGGGPREAWWQTEEDEVWEPPEVDKQSEGIQQGSLHWSWHMRSANWASVHWGALPPPSGSAAGCPGGMWMWALLSATAGSHCGASLVSPRFFPGSSARMGANGSFEASPTNPAWNPALSALLPLDPSLVPPSAIPTFLVSWYLHSHERKRDGDVIHVGAQNTKWCRDIHLAWQFLEW